MSDCRCPETRDGVCVLCGKKWTRVVNPTVEDLISALAPKPSPEVAQLLAELAAESALVDALNTQRGVDAVASLRAVEEAREEQREACARHLGNCAPEEGSGFLWAQDCRTTPLTATPLAERIALLEGLLKVEKEWTAAFKKDAEATAEYEDKWNVQRGRAEKAESRVKELEAERLAIFEALPVTTNGDANLPAQVRDYIAERDALKAELAAAQQALMDRDAMVNRFANSYETELASLKAELAESQRQATLAQELREERNNAMQESASLRTQANERMDGLVDVARALGLTRAIMRIPEIVGAASSLKAQVERLTAALGNLVTWGRWARKRVGVAMETPNSGALTAAEDLLKEKP